MRQTCLNMIYQLAKQDDRIFFIGSDVGVGTLDQFKKEMPDRFFMEGVSEANIIGMAAGLAMGVGLFVRSEGLILLPAVALSAWFARPAQPWRRRLGSATRATAISRPRGSRTVRREPTGSPSRVPMNISRVRPSRRSGTR